jgi:8-oxo-dGTP pyrophosphatase MutT (NUDIX family)
VARAVGNGAAQRQTSLAEMVGLVRAAGGVVYRRVGDDIEVLIVHRPRYDDWSIPKGKCEPGETDEVAALREVHEETGLTCALGPEVGATEYVDHRGRDKRVRFWLMQPLSGEFTPNDEVDQVAWLGPDAALAVLSAEGERAILRAAAALLGAS